MSQITVLIADDHALFREGLRLVLAQENGIQVVGEATDGTQVLSMTEALRPDILLLNVRLPEVNGLDALLRIRAKSPGTKVLILPGYPEDDFTVKALQRGAKGLLSKTLTSADIVKAVRVTYAGELWAERKMLTQTLDSLLQKVNAPAPQKMHEALTDREREIVTWVIQEMTNKEIAAQLGISDNTVKTHLSNISGMSTMRNCSTPLVRVVVAENHPDYRELLCEQLRAASDLDVIGEARDGWEAVAATGRLKPDVLILDLNIQGVNSLDVLYMTRWYSPDTKVIIISVYDEESIVQEVLRQGARGYIVKGDRTDLKKAITVVHNGEVWVRRRVLAAIIKDLRRLAELTFSTTAAEYASE